MAEYQTEADKIDIPSEIKAATQLLNRTFGDENQITLWARLYLGINMISCVLRDVENVAMQVEIVGFVVDQISGRFPTLDLSGFSAAAVADSSGELAVMH